MDFGDSRIEGLIRVCAIISLILAACLLGFDHQTQQILFINRKATFTSFKALSIMVYVDSVAAAYNLLQLCKCWISVHSKGSIKVPHFNIYLFWISFLLDQVAVYITFAAHLEAMEASLLAVTGSHSLQWLKLCDRFTRFCRQVGGSLLCGYFASLLMAVISSISAFNLFRHYSPKHFLLPKIIK